MTSNVLFRNGLAIFVLFCLGACAASTAPSPQPQAAQKTFADAYEIGVGDQLRIDVWRNPELSVQVPVRPDGMITVPVVGDVNVGGKQPNQVGKEIADHLSQFIREPVVTVIVESMGSNEYLTRVRVTGAVANPSSIPYRNGMTVMDVVLDAGGITEFASPARASLYRSSGETLKVRLDQILNRGDLSTNYPLQPGDVVTVPERVF